MSGAQSVIFGSFNAPHPTGTLDGTSAFRSSLGVANFPLDTAPGKQVQSGAVTANTLKTILSLSGKGVISFLGLQSGDVTSRTHRVKVTLDGTVIFDATTAATTSTATAFMVIGTVAFPVSAVASIVDFEPMAFNTSLLVEYASSLTETNKTYLSYRYYPA